MNAARSLLSVLTALIIGLPASALASPSFPDAIPHGDVNSCGTCHTGVPALNSFGVDFKANGKQWDATIALLDSDDDGASNGLELQDPEGTWRMGDADPGAKDLVTHPADANDTPEVIPGAEGDAGGEGEGEGEGADGGEGEGEGADGGEGDDNGANEGGAANEGGEGGAPGDENADGADGEDDSGGSSKKKSDDGGCFSIAAAGGGGTDNAPAVLVVLLLGAAAWTRRRN